MPVRRIGAMMRTAVQGEKCVLRGFGAVFRRNLPRVSATQAHVDVGQSNCSTTNGMASRTPARIGNTPKPGLDRKVVHAALIGPEWSGLDHHGH